MYINNPEIQQIARIAFPNYSGRKFQVLAFSGPKNIHSYWDGGSRDSYVFVNLNTGKTMEVPENGTFYTAAIGELKELPEGIVLVEHSIFCGKDAGITVFVHPNNLTKMLPAPTEVNNNELIVLVATRSLKSSYGGILNYRFHEARQITGIGLISWEKARQSCIAKGLLNKSGAITDNGRNVAGNKQLYGMKVERAEVL